MQRQEMLNYINDEYDITPDYLWDKFPKYAAFRHEESDKWFALLMNVEPDQLDIEDEKNNELDILNVKCEQELIHGLTNKDYIAPGYHMSKEHWVSIVLEYIDDDSWEHVSELIEDSFHLTEE